MKSFLLGLLILTSSLSVGAAPTHDDLRQIEQQIRQEQQAGEASARKAEALSGEVKDVQRQMIQLARTVQQKESDLTRLEEQQQRMLVRQKELQDRLALTDKQQVQIITGLQTLALRPPELAFMHLNAPIDTIRSRMLMGYSLPIVQGINRQTRDDLAELSRLRNDIREQIVRIKSTQSQLSEQSTQMDKLLQQKAIMQAQYQVSQSQSKERVKTLASQARDLKDLLDKLEMEKKKAAQNAARYKDMNRPVSVPMPVATGVFAKAKGRLPYPAPGPVTEQFGSTTVSGAHTKGLTIATRAQAHVIAPFDGTVLFSGPFKGYGELVILDHGDGYLTLLAGMERVNPTVGQEVLAGEPIGQMKSYKPELYLEIRQDGQAIDPEPWFLKKS